MIVYKKTNGMAYDLTFKSPDILAADDIIYGEGDILPDIMTLHDQVYLDVLAQEALEQVHKQESIMGNLPSWTQVSTAVDNISNLAEAKKFLKKLSRVVYWLAKDQEN